MQNVDIKTEGDRLIITVDLTKNQGISKSGKSQIIATTAGNATVKTPRGDVKIGLNVYTSR
jgi:hypothetical protein